MSSKHGHFSFELPPPHHLTRHGDIVAVWSEKELKLALSCIIIGGKKRHNVSYVNVSAIWVCFLYTMNKHWPYSRYGLEFKISGFYCTIRRYFTLLYFVCCLFWKYFNNKIKHDFIRLNVLLKQYFCPHLTKTTFPLRIFDSKLLTYIISERLQIYCIWHHT